MKITDLTFCESLAIPFGDIATDGAPATPPESFIVLKFGRNAYTKNANECAFEFTREDAEAIIANYHQRGKDLVIDYDHQSVIEGVQALAAGWITALTIDDEGLRAQCEWTQAGAAHLAAREYRYHSPVIIFRKGGKHPIALHSVALTNHPALHQYAPLVAQDTPTPNKDTHQMNEYLKQLAELTGVTVSLDDNAENADQTAQNVICERIKALAAVENEANEFLKGMDAKTFADVAGKMQGMCPIAEKNELANRLAVIEAEKAVAQAFADGKLVEAQRQWANDYAVKNLEAFNEFVAKAPAILPLNDQGKNLDKPLPKEDKKKDELSDAERKILKALGVSKQAYLKNKAELENKED